MRKDIMNRLWTEAYTAFLDWKYDENIDCGGDNRKYHRQMAINNARYYDSLLNQMPPEQYQAFREFIECLQFSENNRPYAEIGILIDISGEPEPATDPNYRGTL